ncbi:hypothetical protein GYB62_02890 [bacterium]|nr:hypothetical protein [bacterium]
MSSEVLLQDLESFVQQHLPAAVALDLSVTDYNGRQLTAVAPLEKNFNDKRTAFGGSLYCVSVLACWSMLYLQCRERDIDPDIVIVGANVRYFAPVKDEQFAAVCTGPEPAQWDSFFEVLRRKGRAKVALSAEVISAGKRGFGFDGEFAVIGQK